MPDPITGIMAGSAILGAGTSLFGASKASDAAEKVADTSAASSHEANVLQKYMYDIARADQAPWRTAGGSAVNYISKLLGIPNTAPAETGGTATPTTSTSGLTMPNKEDYRLPGTGSYDPTPDILSQVAAVKGNQLLDAQGNVLYTYPEGGRDAYKGGEAQYDTPRYDADVAKYKASLTPAEETGGTAEPLNLTNILRATPGYQWQKQQGINALNKSAAAKGMLKSGSAMKGIVNYAEGLADQTYENYLNRIFGVAGLGQTSTNSTQAAGTNYANQAGANIINAGNAQASGYINQANALTGGLNGVTNSINSGMNNYLMYSLLNKRYGG